MNGTLFPIPICTAINSIPLAKNRVSTERALWVVSCRISNRPLIFLLHLGIVTLFVFFFLTINNNNFCRLNNSSNAPECVMVMDESEDQFKDGSREYEAEQPSLCESITMGVGLLTGSAPVNIPRSGLDRHPPRLSPSPPSVNLFSGIGVHEMDGSKNSSSLFFNRVTKT